MLLPYVGIGAGLALWSFAVGSHFSVEALQFVSLIGGLVLLPDWRVWTGWALQRVA